MNKQWVLHQLEEANQHLGELIERIRADEDDGFPELYARLPGVYRHLNCAWKTRDVTDKNIEEAFKAKLTETPEWKGFPHDLDPFIHD